MPDAGSSDPLPFLYSFLHEILNDLDLLSCSGWLLTGVKDLLVLRLKGLPPVHKILSIIEAAAGIMVKDGEIDPLQKLDDYTILNKVEEVEESLILGVFLLSLIHI